MAESGLVASYLMDGHGRGEPLDWHGIARWRPEQGVLWVHLNRDSADSQAWLRDQSGIDEVVVDALLAESTRPRCAQIDAGIMLVLRGVNLNPGADPEDMVSIRLWIEQDRVVSVRMRRLLSITDLREALDRGHGPQSVGSFVIQLAEKMISRMANVVTEVDDEVDRLQDQVLVAESRQLRSELTRLRREIIALRRHLAPQRDALVRLAQIKTPWLGENEALHVREEAERVTRYVEDLDAARERAAVTQEELTNRLSEQMNARMYVLSVVAAVFLPLGFLTGLLGVNVGGIPLADSPWGFVDVVLILAAITVLQVLVFRWRRWF